MYINGSDILLSIAEKQFLHSTGHQTTYDTTTKERAVKAVETAGISASMFKEVSVNGLSISITANGLRKYGDNSSAGAGTSVIKDLWRKAKPVRVECYLRKQKGITSNTARDPYLVGMFIITKVTEGSNAEDDATLDVELQMSGAPLVWAPDKSDLDIPEDESAE